MIKKIVFAVIIIFSALILFVSCDDKDAGDDVTDTNNIDLIKRVSDRFEEIYLAYNEKRFDDYVGYYKIDEEQKNLMLEGLTSYGSSYESKYEIRNVYAFENNEGTISATIIYYAVSNNPDGQTFIIEETMYYKMMEEDGNLFISSYEMGPQKLVE